MTDHPIIFSAPMVRALLNGRKTMTRRLPKSQPERAIGRDGKELPTGLLHIVGEPRPRVTIGRVITRQEIRYSVGDLLWVRENHFRWGQWDYQSDRARKWMFFPAADDTLRFPEQMIDGYRAPRRIPGRLAWHLRPSIFLPREHSRLTLIVTAVKVERLQDISEEDAKAEGCSGRLGPNPDFPDEWDPTPQEEFQELWRVLHGPGAWDANPYVVAISFSVHRCNIDALAKETA